MPAIIAIVGRPNVGKSTLFNRLSRSRDALVDDQPGITRDRLYTRVLWRDTPLTIIDTGGFDDMGEGPLVHGIKEQVIKAVEDADRVLFLVDGLKGTMPGDHEIADLMRRTDKPFYLVANKIDGPERESLAYDFYQLGVKQVFPISAAHGYGIRSLVDRIVSDLPPSEPVLDDNRQIRIAVLGRPNVGKSSLINRILGSDRLLVSDVPGTTRDTVDTPFRFQGQDYLMIDTAGLRRKSRVKDKIEKFSMIKTIRSIDRCHIAVILLDAEDGIVEQDARICGFALKGGRGLVLGINKWDLVKGNPVKKRKLTDAMDRQLPFVSFAPRVNVSALTGERVMVLFDRVKLVHEAFSKRIGTGEVNRAVEEMVRRNPPPHIGRTRLKVYYATQVGTRPPKFVAFVNRPDKVHFSYRRFMINQLRERFDLIHTPVRLVFRKREGREP